MTDELANCDLGVHERLLLDVDRVAARVHVGAEHEARFAFEALVEFAFGGDGAFPSSVSPQVRLIQSAWLIRSIWKALLV